MSTSRIAVAQMTSTHDEEQNFQTCERLVSRAAERGVRLLSLPENFAFLGQRDDEVQRFKRPLESELFRRYRALAADHGIWLSLGGFAATGPDDSHAYNCHVVVGDDGELRACYRKLHLFDVDLPDATSLRESNGIAPGDEVVAVDSPVARLGLSVCYDLRFAELYLCLAQLGAEVLLVPAAFTATTGKAHWETLLRARAIETQCYVAAAAQFGRHNPRRESHGNAMIVDPWGAVIARCGEGEGLAVADIDLAYLAEVRRRIPVMNHRRPEVYGRVECLRGGLDG
ncbi:MAG: carbon-nitrogen hydrolase family protein [Myxococcota bacterium]